MKNIERDETMIERNKQEALPLSLTVAQTAGFCPGVKGAIMGAERLLQEYPGVKYMYGEIVHNELVVNDLLKAGFRLIHQPDEVKESGVCLVRAHGITLEEEKALQEKKLELVDLTCVWVKKIHKLAEDAKEKKQLFILCGDKNHPEVRGIISHAGKEALVISSEEEAESLKDPGKPVVLAAQTTFSKKTFNSIKNIIKNKMINLEIFDTICSTTADRQMEAQEIAKNSDLVLVVGSAHSSNTNKLFQVCQAYCSQTYLIQRPDQVLSLVKDKNLRQMRIGITAGASTPERMIREVIYVMTEQQNFSEEKEVLNEEAENQEVQMEAEATVEHQSEETGDDEQVATEAVEEKEEFSFSDYIDEIPQLKRGLVVKGSIVRYDDEFVYVDVRDKSEGKVPRHEFVDDPDFDLDRAVENHEEVEVYVRHIKNTDMGKEINLSKARVDFEKHKEVIHRAFEEQTPVTVKVNNVVKDGVIATYGSVDLYIHRTQLELRRVDDLEPYRGKTLEVLITQFDTARRRLRVSGSRRALLQEERKEKAHDVWENIEVGKEYEGRVRSLTKFGAFVDIGGVDGLVHISELSWNRIKSPSEVVAVDDILKVFVLDFDKDADRISLGYRRPENDPYHQIEERFPIGSIVRGIIVRMFPFGAFVEIAPGVDALCHISQISNYHLNHPEDVLQVGMEIDARVLAVSNEERKVSISIKDVEPIDPANPEDFVQHAPRSAERQDDEAQERKPRRKRQRQETKKDDAPSMYVDSSAGSGSSFASLADITVASKEGAKFLQSLRAESEEANKQEEESKVEEEAITDLVESEEVPETEEN